MRHRVAEGEPERKPNRTKEQRAAFERSERKRLIVCFDGTWSTPENSGYPTNVVRLARAIAPLGDDGIPQIVHYVPGLGTKNFVDCWIGGAFGIGLEGSVKGGYRFLANLYRDGDEVYVFGFSRGAFSARSLCGFIRLANGILRAPHLHKLEALWEYYRSTPAARKKLTDPHKTQAFVWPAVRIKCLGVWDTVGALGIPLASLETWNRLISVYHDIDLSPIVDHAFHALAIDEKRGAFLPSLWQRPKAPVAKQVVEQVWFPGVHSNVGGSYQDTDIADLSLRWMMGRVRAHTQLTFRRDTTESLVPEMAWDLDNKKAKINELKAKWTGTIYESRWKAYIADWITPTIRVIENYRPPLHPNRLFPSENAKPFAQAIHWSALQRFLRWRAEDLPPYEPANLQWAFSGVQLNRLQVVDFADEVKCGKPWAQQLGDAPAVQSHHNGTAGSNELRNREVMERY
jgi:uncharacterized protein (DUF2235 family)